MSVLVQFFSWLMDWCHAWFPNWWVDILIFTFLTKILQFPLSLWCHVNSLKMVAVMPESIRVKIEHYGDSEQIGEKTAQLFKREKYHPMLSLVPLGIQIVILMGFVKVIYAIAAAERGSLLGRIPVQDGGISWIMPLAAGAAACVLGFCQNRINPLQREQTRAQQMATNGISVAISLCLGCFVGMGVGLYWAASNLFSILVQLACNATIHPASRIDYPALRKAQSDLASLENSLRRTVSREDRRREKTDWKRFFSVANKHLVFYAEGGGYYKYLAPIVEWLLEHSNVVIHYVTNDPHDAVFAKAAANPQFRAYYIGSIRIIPLMMKMDADMVVMTTPDLNLFHIKRSYVRKDVEYIYLSHGPLSVNMCNRKGALDYFDTIFSSGPFEDLEVRALEKIGNLRSKTIVPTGFIYFDILLAKHTPPPPSPEKRIMIAPSHQVDNIFDLCLDELISVLAAPGRKIILRPHPQYVRRTPAKMKAIEQRYANRPDIEIESDFSRPSSQDRADILVTDWSGVSCEFSLVTGNPCIFIDTPMKVLNPDYVKTGLVPTEISFRNRLGRSFPLDRLSDIPPVVADMLAHPETYAAEIKTVRETMYYNFGHSGEAAGRYILQKLIEKQKQKKGQ